MAPAFNYPGDKRWRALGRKRVQSVRDIISAVREKVEVGLARIIIPYMRLDVFPNNQPRCIQISAPYLHLKFLDEPDSVFMH